MEALEKTFKFCVYLQRSELYKKQHSCNTLWGSESWILKEQDRESFEILLLEKTPKNTIAAKKTNKWITEQINPEF